MTEPLKEAFIRIYKEAPQYAFFAPGRVNFLGEHTNCKGNTVLAAAISQGTWLLISPNDKHKFVLHTLNQDDYAEVLVSPHYRSTNIEWVNHPLGVISRYTSLVSEELQGLNMLFSGNIPRGISLSSSGSIEMVTAFALDHIFRGSKDAADKRVSAKGPEKSKRKLDLVKMAQMPAPGFPETQEIIPGYYAVALGEKDSILALDHNALTHQAIPFSLGEYTLLLVDTGKTRPGSAGRISDRLMQCQTALEAIQKERPVQSLCDLSPEEFNELEAVIPNPTSALRARHVVEENDRAQRAIAALRKQDIETFGQLMFSSHQSLTELYELTSRETDLVVEASQRQGVAGARLTGTGGSVLVLVHQAELKNYRKHLLNEYKKALDEEPQIIRLKMGAGVKQL